ncbi:MAG: hypothetical protein RBR13_11630 [Tenuifilaceae bacterium]|nr:hypothetical protein [Tenuifilaceae bacterium]
MRVPANPQLTAIAMAWRNPKASLVADDVLFRAPAVATEEFRYHVHELSQGFTIPETRVGSRGRVTEVSFEGSEVTAHTTDFGIEDPIPLKDVERGKAAGIDVHGQSVEYIMHLLALDREVRVARLCQNPDNYLTGNVTPCASGDKLTNPDADPMEMLNAILDDMFIRPNTMVLNQRVWGQLRRHPNVIRAIFPTSSGKGSVTRQQIMEELELENLFVAGSFVNNARKGEAMNLQRTWGNDICLHYQDRQASSKAGITWGMTVPYGKPVATSWFDKDIGLRGGERVRVGHSLAEIVTARAAGALITGVI